MSENIENNSAKAIEMDTIDLKEIASINLMNTHGLKNNYAERVYNYALYYISKGLYVIPCKKNNKAIIFSGAGAYDRASRDKKKIRSWFDPVEGIYVGCNIAVATGGDSAFVVDIDTINFEGISGHATWNALMHHHGDSGILDAPIVKTPSGGEHIYFRWTDVCGGSKDNLLGPGVDVKGGGDHSRRGHVIAPPSRIDGMEYKWSKEGLISDIPQWIVNVRNINGSGNNVLPFKNNDDGGIEGELLVGNGKGQGMSASDCGMIEEGQINNMLHGIKRADLSTYNEWLEIGMAVHDASGGSDYGLSAWNEWSKDDRRYSENCCFDKWKGFGHGNADGNKITANTLFYRAGVQGRWKPDVRNNETIGPMNNEVTMMMEEMNNRFGFIIIGGRSRVIHKDRGKRQAPLIQMNSFYDLTMNEFVETNDGMSNKSRVWMTHNGRNSYEDIGMFVDDHERDVIYDVWSGFDCVPDYTYSNSEKSNSIQIILDLILEVICDGDEGHYEWVLDWIANIFQDPGEKRGRMGTCVVTKGDKGSGKGTLFNLINTMIGYGHATHITDHNLLVNQFNGWMIGKLFIFVDEAIWGGDKKGEGVLKGMITESKISYQLKGIDQQIGDNFCRVGFASNEDWVVPATKDERRFLVLKTNSKRVGDHEYWTKLYDWLYKEGGKEKFMGYLLDRKITNKLNMAPKTKHLADQVHLKAGPEIQFITEIIEKGEIPNHVMGKCDTITSEMLHNEYIQYVKNHGYGKPKSSSVFLRILKDQNFHNIMSKRKISTSKGKRSNCYEFKNLHKCAEWMNSQGVANIDIENLEEDWEDVSEEM